ncbi:MAG: heavy metal-responsive transcriptional regulator [Actinomycetota bacterium]
MTVSNLANRVGLNPDTIRYYDRIGMLLAPPRTLSGYRLYDESAVRRLRFIKGAQRFGLRLEEIRELLEIRDKGLCPCGHTHTLLQRRIGEVDRELERLTSLRTELAGMIDHWHVEEGSEVPAERWHCAGDLIGADALRREDRPVIPIGRR